MNISPKIILSIGLAVSIGATAAGCYYSHALYEEKWKNESIRIAEAIQSYLHIYRDLIINFYSIGESDQYVTAKKVDLFYDSWRKNYEKKLISDDVNFYGWHFFDDSEGQDFITVFHEEQNIAFIKSFSDAENMGDRTLNDEFGTAPSLAYISSSNYDNAKNFIAFKYSGLDGNKNAKSIFFISLSKILIEQKIKDVAAGINKSISLSVVWSGLRNYHFHQEIYRQVFIFGNEDISISFEPVVPWRIIGPDNIAGMTIGLCGMFLSFLLFLYVSALTRRSELSESAKTQAEERLGEQAKFLEDFLENIPAVLFIKDARKNFEYYMFNKEAETFFGHSREEMLGKTDRDFYSEEQSVFFRSMDEAAMRGGKVIDIPCEIITSNGRESFLHTRKVPIYSANGEPLFLVGLSQDITKRKKTEMELAEYRENLERIVEERTVKLKSAMAKAEDASRLKSEFLATMSHEIRSPMSGVLGMAELLLDTALTQEQRGLTRTILNSGEVLMNIIEDILDFSKIEANKLELDPVAVNMLELVDDVCMLYSSRARDKALELVVRYVPGSEQFVYADPVRVRQVLGNIVNNAIKFTHKGYIVITVSEEKNASLPGDKVLLNFTVEDTGIGIEEKDQARIFEKFSQANSSTTRDYGGTGLGLSICRKLVEMMGGEIAVTSAPGEGSRFSFSLPMTRNSEEIFVQASPPVLKNCRVLIVDDLPVIQTMLCEQLSMAGMICDSAENGREALEKLDEARHRSQTYDIMIIDYLMPSMNGEMLARAISDEPDFRKICLIMLTAAGNPIVGDDFAEKGFSAYISKPVKALNLIDTLAIIWSKYQEGYTNTLIRVDTSSLGTARNEAEDQLKLEGSKILLVEDSRLNQAFVEEVLTQLACDTTTVSNGQEALDILGKKEFDLVLMDCQMPVMDGFEATKRICALKKEGAIRADLPVLALTANAMKGDRQRCMDAGMDDYITKPVRKKELKEKIYFWIKKEKITVKDEQGDDEGSPHISSELLNPALLAEARSLLKDKFDFLLGCYIDDVESYIREMQDAATHHNLEAIVRPAHTIKSTSRRMGALRLSDIAKDIEHAAREAANTNDDMRDASHMMENIKQISSVFEETKKLLREKS